MREAFEEYYQKLVKSYKEAFNSKPTFCYSKRVDKRLVVSEKDADGYVEWEPVYLSKKPNFKKIEQELGFEMCKVLKQFYSTCLFGELRGNLGEKELIFSPIKSRRNLANVINQNYKDGQWLFPNSQIFLIGDACIKGNDNCFICYDNVSDELFIYNNEKGQKRKYKLKSLVYTIENMDPSFEIIK